MELKTEELPDVPNEWVDFVHGTHPGFSPVSLSAIAQTLKTQRGKGDKNAFPGNSCIQSLVRKMPVRSGRAEKSIQRLGDPDSVVVIANLEPVLFGGPLSQILKCLTAAKICAQLNKYSVDAVAVAWIRTHCKKDADGGYCPLQLLDSERELHRIAVGTGAGHYAALENARLFGTVRDLIPFLKEIGKGSFDPGILSELETVYADKDTQSTPGEIFLGKILDAWGMLVVDPLSPWFRDAWERECVPVLLDSNVTESAKSEVARSEFLTNAANDYLLQCFVLPVLGCTIGPGEPASFIDDRGSIERYGLRTPFVWPSISATLIDADSRRTLDKFRIGLADLFGGEADLLHRLGKRITGSSSGSSFDALESEARRCLDRLDGSGPDFDSFRKANRKCRERVLYQLDKMRSCFVTARSQKQQVMKRRIHRACNSLAPGGKTQESSLSTLHFLLRHSENFLSFLYEELELEPSKHQMVEIF